MIAAKALAEQEAVPGSHAPNSEGAPQAVKDPFTRLLDLMLGWAEYAEKDEAEHSDAVQASDIYAAYSAVAEFAEPHWEATPQAQEVAVRQYLDTRLLPLLMGQKAAE